MTWGLIALGAVFGALSRYYLSSCLSGPLGIFLINITGCFLIGLIAGFSPKEVFKSFFVIGFLGSYTTFSSYSLDIVALCQKEKYWQAFYYFALSPIIGVLAAFCGLKLSIFSKAKYFVF